MSGVIARGYKQSKASIWSVPLKQTLHINDKFLFYWLKTRERGPIANEVCLLRLIEPLPWLNLQFLHQKYWGGLKVKLL